MFIPPRCPYLSCSQHYQPEPGFFRRRGHYRPLCRPEGVPRFRCTTCKRSFSRQTFRHDYHDHRPDWNVPLFMLLASGVGLRQSARVLDADPRSVQDKKAKMSRTTKAIFCRCTCASVIPLPDSKAVCIAPVSGRVKQNDGLRQSTSQPRILVP